MKKETNPKKQLRNSFIILAFGTGALFGSGLVNAVIRGELFFSMMLMVFGAYFFGALVMLYTLKDKLKIKNVEQ